MACESKRLEDVAEVLDMRCGPVRGTQRILRSGPYRLYVETGWVPFDDYAFEGPHLLLGSVCNVESPQGTLKVIDASGRFAVTDLYHVVACADEDDTQYLRLVLSRMPARDHADMSGQTVRLSAASLRAIRVPWPCRETRRAFARFMAARAEEQHACSERARELFEQGAARCREASWRSARIAEMCDVHEGRFLDADARRCDGRVPVVCSQGAVARTDEAGVDGPCIVLGQAGQYVLGFRMESGAYPLSDSVALTMKGDAPVPFEAVVLGLAAQGVRPRLRVVDRSVDARALPLERIGGLRLAVPPADEAESFRLEARALLANVDDLERRASAARHDADEAARLLLAGDDRLLDLLAERAPESGETPAPPEAVAAQAPGGDARSRAASEGAPAPVADGVCVDAASEDAGSGAIASAVRERAREQVRNLVAQALSALRREGDAAATSFDAAWELLPLLFLRSVDEGAPWQAALSAPDPAQAVDRALGRLAGENPALGFLDQLTSASSGLDASERLSVIRGLDALPDEACDGALVRWTALEHAVEPAIEGGRSVERRVDAPCPDAVVDLIVSAARAFCPNARSAFDPCAREGGVLARTRSAYPGIACSGQAVRFSDALAATLAARCEGWAFDADALHAGDSLQDDAFVGADFDIVASVLPPNGGEWSDARPDADDPRWMFGVPPRNKANLAWLQHAHAHRAPGGYAVLAAANAVLHEKRGCEPDVRRALIASGCVRAVIALPGGLFDDERPPLSVIVLGDPRPGECETLFVDALGCGTPSVPDAWPPHRALDEDTADRVLAVVDAWARTGSCDPEPGFCRSAPKAEIEELGNLAPWSFV